jgi:hypothetical protein
MKIESSTDIIKKMDRVIEENDKDSVTVKDIISEIAQMFEKKKIIKGQYAN